MKNWPTWGKWIFWIAIILILVAIYNYKTISDKLGINLRKYCGGGIMPIYRQGGDIPSGTHDGRINPGTLPVFRNVYPVYYPTCPDWTGRLARIVSFYGASNLFFPNIDGKMYENCPTCIIYNGVTYYFNGSDADGCYYQANYYYIYPTYYTFFSRFHGHHGGPGGPGSGTGPGGPGGHGSGTGGGGPGGPGSGTGTH